MVRKMRNSDFWCSDIHGFLQKPGKESSRVAESPVLEGPHQTVEIPDHNANFATLVKQARCSAITDDAR